MKDLEYRKRIGARIGEIRKQKGMTALQLSEKTGLNQSNVFRIESGRYSTGIDILGKIADALECKIDFIQNDSK